MNDDIFSFYGDTLKISPWINCNLQNFLNVRRLSLGGPLSRVLEQLQSDVLSYLEHLSVSYAYHMYEIVLLHESIFSNRFFHLRFCELHERRILLTIPHWTQSPFIRILKTEFIDSMIYKIILRACPNLKFLKSLVHSSTEISTNIPPHENLKQMIVDLPESNWFHDGTVICGFLTCVSNLERLKIH